uniref:Peptidase_C25 domain-containing protein n=1 Tax=Taenia asiatica TaxID=60517 RepID=A0A0R3VYJ4_TAEAS
LHQRLIEIRVVSSRAYLGAFKNGENVLIVIGSDVSDNQTPWRTRDMIELNIALGSLYPLYQPQNRTQRYEQFAIFSASRKVTNFSESVESGRRIARYISSGQNVGWNCDNLLPLLKSTFKDNVILVNSLNSSQGDDSTGHSPGGKGFHLVYKPDGAANTVFLISSSSVNRGLATIVGFFETLRRLQPKGTEFQAVIGCFNGGRDFLSDLHDNPMNEVLGVQIPSQNTDVYVIGAENRNVKRRTSDYYGQKLDYEFGPLTESNHVNNFIKKSVGNRDSRMIFFLEEDGGGSSSSPVYSTPIAGLVTRYLLKHLKQPH